MLPRSPRCVAEAAKRRLERASDMGATLLFIPVAGDVRLVLSAGGVCSPQGLGRASNPRVIEAKTIDPHVACG
jgi:hypothetical protein